MSSERIPTDAELIKRSLEDPEQFGVIFQRHVDAIHRYLQTRVGTGAEDLAADVFILAFRQRHRYDEAHSSARPWLFGIATNLVRHQRRKESRELRALERSQRPLEPLQLEDQSAESNWLTSDLGRALHSLTRAERDVLLLYALGELSYDEISVALNVPIGTVRSRLARARTKVRELLATLRARDR
jgi:RNA polymerase sigma factor (sigma-70 family)